ncbi:Uncharacterised protein [Sphingobacterium multivorum]|jgi:hypothetical protein|uniref:Uncharacterized protein n=1 Tax=Sphingobacterium multivorum TaxID=28454 RepID=A0A2X2JK59_SPHMU|nr:Uncharacterised protein [Sphingobacterium multivorum]SUJ32135.1 Uncharacterised protein [Sphingobacterium multivorum]
MIIKLLKSIKNSGSTQVNRTISESVTHRTIVSMRMRMHMHFHAC